MKKITLIISAMILFSCGGGNDKSNTKTVTEYELVPKDTMTKPEDGGYGFENIAESMGFETYTFTEEDYKYFGHPDAQKGGNLKFTTSRFPATFRVLGQHYNYTENYYIIGALCYESLITTHPVTLEYIPALASHWKLSEDKMTFYFRIDPDARWSDGQEVTADDVVASYDIRMDETILFPSTQVTYGKIQRPEAVSKYIVKVKSNTLNWRNMLYFGGMNILPEHYLKDLDGTAYLEEYNFKLLPGTGPYVIKDEDIVNQESYTVTRRDNWWREDHRTQNICIILIK
ncbi:hypothetical protein Ct9H90mP12_1390 [bacterium]|nr:MAG: hypothetical protein Ct9H90mP12_1390 [bacterium]